MPFNIDISHLNHDPSTTMSLKTVYVQTAFHPVPTATGLEFLNIHADASLNGAYAWIVEIKLLMLPLWKPIPYHNLNDLGSSLLF